MIISKINLIKKHEENNLEIRKISKSDLEELAKLMVSVYNAPPWNDKWTVETAMESLTDISDFPKFFGNVIVDENKIIGAIIGHIRRYATESTFYIDEFYISEEYRWPVRQKNFTKPV